MQYQRHISQRLLNLAKFFPAIVLTGARQTGKTTLLRHLFPDHHYVTLDIPSVAESAETDPEAFLEAHPTPLLIDEVQYAPNLFRHLKIEIDKNPEQAGQFILTGSQKFTLMQGVSESLAGRAGIIELECLSPMELGEDYRNFVESNGPSKTLARGLYPKLWKNQDFPSHEYYGSYIATYLERDVRQLLNVNSLRDFDRFMRACAIRSGSTLNKAELAKDVGIHHKTANDWIGVLAASNQVTLLEPYFNNETKRIVKSPKLYFNDTGVLCSLLGLRESNIAEYADIGKIWETHLFAKMRMENGIREVGASLWFYRDQVGLEVDFLAEKAGQLDLIEAKWSQNPSSKSTTPMKKLSKKLSNISATKVASRTQQSYPLEDSKVINGFFDDLI